MGATHVQANEIEKPKPKGKQVVFLKSELDKIKGEKNKKSNKTSLNGWDNLADKNENVEKKDEKKEKKHTSHKRRNFTYLKSGTTLNYLPIELQDRFYPSIVRALEKYTTGEGTMKLPKRNTTKSDTSKNITKKETTTTIETEDNDVNSLLGEIFGGNETKTDTGKNIINCAGLPGCGNTKKETITTSETEDSDVNGLLSEIFGGTTTNSTNTTNHNIPVVSGETFEGNTQTDAKIRSMLSSNDLFTEMLAKATP